MNYISEILLYRTPSGKIRSWQVFSEGAEYYTETGEVGFNPKQSSRTVCRSSNEGRSNKNTASEAAVNKAKSMERDKVAEGYCLTMGELKIQDRIPRAMLAKPNFEKEIPHIRKAIKDRNCYIQPKLDGFRCLADRRGLWTRKLRPIYTCPHIEKELRPVFEEHPNLVVDGELFNFELRNDFGKIQGLITKQDIGMFDTLDTENLIQFHVYDALIKGPFIDRFKEIRAIVGELEHIEMTKTIRVGSLDSIYENHAKFVEAGYEGTMVRSSGPDYEQNKRARQLVKLKDVDDEEFTIVDISEGKGQWSGYAKTISCVDKNGVSFSSGCAGNQEHLRMILQNADKYIGGKATVQFNGKFPSGVPRFPVAIKFFTL